MVSLNGVLDYVKARLGVSHRQLELADEGMIKCILEQSLPEFSIYFPYYCGYSLDTSSENRVPNSDNMFFIPESIDDFDIMGVQAVMNAGVHASGGMGMDNQAMGTLTMLGTNPQSAIMAMAGARMSSTMMDASGFLNESWTWLPPNIIRFNANIGQDAALILRTTHKKDLTTIPHGAMGWFKELALIDVATDIMSIRRYFSNVQTIFAQIQMDVDYLKDIADRRNDLIERFRKEQLKYAHTRKIYIA